MARKPIVCHSNEILCHDTIHATSGYVQQCRVKQHAKPRADKKERSLEFRRLSEEAGFTPAAIITFARSCKNEAGWKDRLGSNVTQRITEQVFAAMQQYS